MEVYANKGKYVESQKVTAASYTTSNEKKSTLTISERHQKLISANRITVTASG